MVVSGLIPRGITRRGIVTVRLLLNHSCQLHHFKRHQDTSSNSSKKHFPPIQHKKNILGTLSWQYSCNVKQYLNTMEVTPAVLGVEIRGIDLKKPVSEELIQQFREDVHKHRLLIFKDQGTVSGERHVEISKWFGELESTFYKHPKSPHPDVFRVSNVESEGCLNVGRTGWHIDGSFMEKPFAFSIYHMNTVPKTGDTAFVPLTELIEGLPKQMRDRWDRLWMVPDRRDQAVHPLIYPHPVTKKPTLCFHLGMTASFVWDYDSAEERQTDFPETVEILQEIHNEIVKDNRKLVYSHKWEVGDFIVSDNLSVGHEATPETQYDESRVGLRVLHRTTIRGTNIPEKDSATRR